MKSRFRTAVLLAGLLVPMTYSAQAIVNFPLSAWQTALTTMWDGTPFVFYGFSRGLTYATMPGPTIVCNEGDSLVINMRNRSQGAHHTIHLHGLDVNQATDGVPHTSFGIGHGANADYAFRATHAGTYFYHCHVLSVWHVALGMYGSLIVKAANGANEVWTGGPTFDRDYNWLSSELDANWFDSIPNQHAGDSTFTTIPVLRYHPEYFLLNGKSHHLLDTLRSVRILANTGDKVHLRIGNMGYFANRVIFPAQLNALVVSSDGRPLPTAQAWDTLWVYPGERYSVLLDLLGPAEDSISFAWSDLYSGQQWREEFIPVIHGVGIGMSEPQATELDLVAYPQPADDWVLVQLPEFKKAGEFRMIATDGRVVQQGAFGPGQTLLSIPVHELSSGIYHLHTQAGGRVAATQVAVQR
jgi:FtsP/CotA-like multicopper oxidase with cupredoxin domain